MVQFLSIFFFYFFNFCWVFQKFPFLCVILYMLVRSGCCAAVGMLLQQIRINANQISVVKMEATSYQYVRVNRRTFLNRVIN